MTPLQAVGYALVAGFSLPSAQIIAAIAQAESSLVSNARNTNDDGSIDRGILQINDKWHPEVSDEQAYDIQSAFVAGYVISNSGTNFTSWVTYNTGAYYQYLQHIGDGSNNMALNKSNEVCDIATISQFYPSETEFACGFFSAACIRYAGAPGRGPVGSHDAIMNWAENEYKAEYGSNGINQTGGVSIDDMHRLLVKALDQLGGPSKSHYLDLKIDSASQQASDIAEVHAALQSFYPVVCTMTEISVFDMDLGKNPYFWGASGTHVFIIVGETSDSWLVHDSANVVGTLNGPNSPRPMPRRYRKSSLALQWATMARMPWLVPFPAGWDYKGHVLNK